MLLTFFMLAVNKCIHYPCFVFIARSSVNIINVAVFLLCQTRKEINKGKPNTTIKNATCTRPNSHISPLMKGPIEKRKAFNPRNNVLRKLNNSGKISNTMQSSKEKVTSSTKSHSVTEDAPDIKPVKKTPITDAVLETSLESNKKDASERNEAIIKNKHENISTLYRELIKSNIVLNNALEENNKDKDVITQNNMYQNFESEPISLFVDADKGLRIITDNSPKSPHASALNNNEMYKNNYSMDVQPLKPVQGKELKSNSEVEPRKSNVCQNLTSEPFKVKQDQNINTNTKANTQKSAILITEKIHNEQNKECTINFNLNIEIKDCNAVCNDTFSKCYRFNTEKQSQTNLQIDLDKECIQTNGKYYKDQSEVIEQLVENSFGGQNKVIIIRCLCNDTNYSNSTIKNDVNLKECVILVPQEKISERAEEFNQIRYREGEEDVIHVNNIYPREKISSKMDIVKECKACISPCSLKTCKSLPKSSDYQVDTENKTVTTWNTATHSTQTDWCNTLVEARCNEDGRYTFHLPPLEKLKQFNL